MAATASSGNPWKANNDPKDFVGCKIEIISNSDIRYVGTLYTFDPHASTISLKDVQSFGTESRRSGDQAVAPSHELYEYIVFRISDIKDLCVCEPPSPNSRRLSHVDSAIVSASDESQQTRSSNGFPRIRYTSEFMRSSWNENRGRSGSANNASTSSGNLGTVGGNNNNNRNSGSQQGNNRSSNGNGNNNNNGYRGGRGGGRGGNRGGMSGGFRGGYNNNNGGNNGRRGAPVFPYPSQAGPQDWLTRYQKDMNLKAEFQNVNPDLSVLANIASSSELPADKVRDMMEGNWEAFLTAAELPGKTEKAPTHTKAEYTDGFFDSLTAPPPTPNETMYNRRKDFETFGPANNNNNSSNGPNNNGRYNNNNRQNNGNQQSNQNQRQSTQNGGGWGNNNNQGGQSNQRQQQQSGDGYGQNNSQGYGGRNNVGQGNYNNNGRFGNNNRGNQRGRGGNGGQQRGGYVSQRGGQRGFGGNLNSLLGSMNNGGGFTQRDLVIPAPSNGGSNWTFNQRTQAALWTPAVGLDLTQQPTSSTTWTFACNSPAISESGYDALSPSPVA